MSIKGQAEFSRCINVIVTSSNEDNIISCLGEVHKLAIVGEIRDYDWWENEDINLYRAIYLSLCHCWTHWDRYDNGITKHVLHERESLSLLLWARICNLSEFDNRTYEMADLINGDFLDLLFNRISTLASQITTIASQDEEKMVLSPMKSVRILQFLAISTYQHRVSIRSSFRRNLIHHCHQLQALIRSKTAHFTGQDGGNSRDHVKYLLQILLSIIQGLQPICLMKKATTQLVDHIHTADESTCDVIAEGQENDDEDNESDFSSYSNSRFNRKAVAEDDNGSLGDDADSSNLIIAKVRYALLMEGLFPLHAPNEMVVWRDQIPIIQSYHEDLVKCIVGLCSRTEVVCHDVEGSERHQDSMLVCVLRKLLETWPDAHDTNTPKQVLLLHEIEILLERCTMEEFIWVQKPFLDRLVKCVGTNADNIRPAQRALEYFKNIKLLDLLLSPMVLSPRIANVVDENIDRENIASVRDVTMMAVLPALYRGGILSWNPTVNKMTALALKALQDYDKLFFERACGKLFDQKIRENPTSYQKASSKTNAFTRPDVPMPLKGIRAMKRPVAAAESLMDSKDAKGISNRENIDSMGPPAVPRSVGSVSAMSKYITSLPDQRTVSVVPSSRFMGNNDVGSKGGFDIHFSTRDTKGQPPATVTGVAPWAMMQSSQDKTNPPVTITGIAPWAQIHAQPKDIAVSSALSIKESSETSDESDPKSAIEKVEEYMKRCYEFIFESGIGGSSVADYLSNTVLEKPILLPNLKFHDLVFGNDLGEGAFSVVRYCRQITKGKPQSLWPEYAIKVIDAHKVRKYNYAASVIREIALLHILKHPNICRLLSTFRYSNNAYLVLEHASKGDLHNCLLKTGKLHHRLLRFVVGEIASGISVIHEYGFCYNDLKPENILITALGHIKITDFGACRPITIDAKRQLLLQCDSIMDMRNGNWKDEEKDSSYCEEMNRDVKELFSAETIRKQLHGVDLDAGHDHCEGTPAYMPPEAFSNDGTIAACGDDIKTDSWALGCIAYFCYHGKPRFFGEPEQVLHQMETWFMQCDLATNDIDHHHNVKFQEVDGNNRTDVLEDLSCEAFIHSLLTKLPQQRASVTAAMDHPYVTVGYLPKFSPLFDKLSVQIKPPIYQPRTLYNIPSTDIPWPDIANDGNQDGSTEKWARRQFSTLWAPMPKSYDVDNNSGGKDVDNKAAQKLLLKTHCSEDGLNMVLRGSLPVVDECDTEVEAPFIIVVAESKAII